MKRFCSVCLLLLCACALGVFAGEQKTCSIENGTIVVANPLANWKFSKNADEGSCILEKTDSPENPLYMTPQLQVYYKSRDNIKSSAGDWAESTKLYTSDILGPAIKDVKVGGKAAKLLTYTKKEQNFKKTKTLEVVYHEYFVVEPGYAVSIMLYCAAAEKDVVLKEAQQILAQLKLK